jgi:hypothetical protein
MIARFRGPNRAEIRFVLADLAPPSCGFSAAEAIVIKPFLEQDFLGPILLDSGSSRASRRRPGQVC